MPIEMEYQQKSTWMSGSTGFLDGDKILGITKEEVYNRVEYNKKIFPLKFRFAEEKYRAIEPYERAILDWRSLVDRLTSLSLTTLYARAIKTLSGTDVCSYARLLDDARRYQIDLSNYVSGKTALPEMFTRNLEFPDMEPTEENTRRWAEMAEKEGHNIVYEKVVNWDRVSPLDLRALPRATFRPPALGDRLAAVVPDVAILLALTLLLLVAMARRALRFEVM